MLKLANQLSLLQSTQLVTVREEQLDALKRVCNPS